MKGNTMIVTMIVSHTVLNFVTGIPFFLTVTIASVKVPCFDDGLFSSQASLRLLPTMQMTLSGRYIMS